MNPYNPSKLKIYSGFAVVRQDGSFTREVHYHEI